MNQSSIILFDGICNLCNGAVQFVIKHDPHNQFTFASMQSDSGQKLLQQYQLEQTNFDSFILIQDNTVFKKSTAALRVAKNLSGPVQLLSKLIIVPAVVRDAVYNVIARNRYKWFGKKNTCMIPTPAHQSRFLN